MAPFSGFEAAELIENGWTDGGKDVQGRAILKAIIFSMKVCVPLSTSGRSFRRGEKKKGREKEGEKVVTRVRVPGNSDLPH